jgi:hypothetical protein
MKKHQVCVLVFALTALVSLLLVQVSRAQQKTGAATTDTPRSHEIVSPDELQWVPAPPKLPPGAQFAVLEGDRSKPGAPYVFRAKLPDGYSVPPHWHSMDENITVIKGVFGFAVGEKFDRAAIRDLPAGSYLMMPKGERHYNLIKGETILQFHGIGPYDIHYVNPADDPSRKTSCD